MTFGTYKELPLTELVPYERNARTHSPEQVAQLARSIDQFGLVGSIVVRDGIIAKGHGTLEAVRKLLESGQSIYPAPGRHASDKDRPEPYPHGSVPVLDVSGWTDKQFRAYVLADNKLALNAGWDLDLLSSELASLKLEGFELDMLGFSIEELGSLFAEDPAADPDFAPELPVDPVCKPGDVWILGPHRVMCGDATKLADYHRLMGAARADCVWTDPPYNVAYEGAGHKLIANDDMEDGAFRAFLLDAFTGMHGSLKPGGAIYVAHADLNGTSGDFATAIKAAGFHIQNQLIWSKNSPVLGRCDYQSQHEPIWYGWKKGSAHRFYGGRKQTTMQELGPHSAFTQLDDGRWQCTVGNQTFIVEGAALIEEVIPSVFNEDKPKRNDFHPTMKPVALIERHLKHSARPHDLILDPFGGSGSTLIAAERLGMCARLLELDPAYVDVIVGRWEAFTGRSAELEALNG